MNSDEVLRRFVLDGAAAHDTAIPRLLKAVIDEINIGWARVNGRTLSVYCYTERDGHKLEREFGGKTMKSINPRDTDYWIWQWEAPYR